MDFIFDDFPDKTLLKGFEGGAVFSAEKEGKFYLILDESTMASILDEDDLPDELVQNNKGKLLARKGRND